MQQRLKPTIGAARAKVIATEFLNQVFVLADLAVAALDAGF